MKIRPIKLEGNWEEGYALDLHITHSEFLGYNELGYPEFNNTRSYIGEQVYQLKYQQNSNALEDIIKLITPFLIENWKIQNKIDLIVPVPSNSKNSVIILSKAIGKELNKPVKKLLSKTNEVESKNLSQEDKNKVYNLIKLNKEPSKYVNILLIDDLYDSGSTLNTAANILETSPKVNNIYVLTMTKTRGG